MIIVIIYFDYSNYRKIIDFVSKINSSISRKTRDASLPILTGTTLL